VASSKKTPKTSTKKTSSKKTSSSKTKTDSGPGYRDVKIDAAKTFTGAKIDPVSTYGAARVERAPTVTAPEMGGATLAGRTALNRSGDAPFRESQLRLAQALEARASGRAPSIAEMQMREGTSRAVAQQNAFVAAQRLRNPAQAARLAMTQGAAAQRASNLEASKLRMAEAIEAQRSLGEVTAAGRAQEGSLAAQQATLDQNVEVTNAGAQNTRTAQQAELGMRGQLANQTTAAEQAQYQAQLEQQAASEGAQMTNTRATQQAQLGQQADIANTQAMNARATAQGQITSELERQKMGGASQVASSRASAGGAVGAAQASAYGNITSQGIAQEGANYRTELEIATGLGQNQGAANQAYDSSRTGAEREAAGDASDSFNAGIGAGGEVGAAIASDERLKKNVSSADREVEEMLDKIKPKEFEYKNSSKHGKGERTGVMAQDLEESKAGRQMVVEGEDGKYIDWKRGLGALLAASANLNKRLEEIEGKKKK
jgi:hypothetical protein